MTLCARVRKGPKHLISITPGGLEVTANISAILEWRTARSTLCTNGGLGGTDAEHLTFA